jgi:isopenicillin N synthase-like dioxygenase
VILAKCCDKTTDIDQFPMYNRYYDAAIVQYHNTQKDIEMKKVIAQNNWLIAVKQDESIATFNKIEIRFVPLDYSDSFSLSKTDIVKIAKKFMPTLAKKLGLPARFFTPELYFCSMEGYGAKDTIYLDRYSKKEDMILANINQAFADIEEEINELVMEYAIWEEEAAE